MTVRSRPKSAILPVLLLLAAAALPAPSLAETPVFPGMEKVIQHSILERFEAGEERVGVIILLTGFRDLAGKVPADDPALLARFQEGVTRRQETVERRDARDQRGIGRRCGCGVLRQLAGAGQVALQLER